MLEDHDANRQEDSLFDDGVSDIPGRKRIAELPMLACLGWLSFNPPNAPASRFAGQELLVRYGPWDGDVTFHAPQITETDIGRVVRVRATYEVIDWLFGDGQTALRQAMTKVAQAVAGTPNANRTLVELADKATTAQNPGLPIEDFIAAASLSRALRELQRAVGQRQVWDERAR